MRKSKSKIRPLQDFENVSAFYHGRIFDLERQNIHSALLWAMKKDYNTLLIEGAINYYDYLTVRGLYEQAKGFISAVSEVTEKIGDSYNYALSLLYLGRIAINQSDYKRAKKTLLKGLPLAKELEDQSLICDFTQSLGVVIDHGGDFAGAKKMQVF